MSLKAHILDTRWIHMHILVPLVVLVLYFVSFSTFLAWLLPEYGTNVNAVFATRAYEYLLPLGAGACLIFLVFFRMWRRDTRKFENNMGKLRVGDFLLILLPLTPIVQFILNNQDILSPLGSLYVLAVFVMFSVLYVIVAPVLLGIIGSTKTLMILGLAFTSTITNMALLSAEFGWYEHGSLIIQGALFCAIFLVGWILYNLVGRKSLYLVVAAFFVTNTAIQLAPGDRADTALSGTDNKLVELIGSKTPTSTPNIYLLVYDAYVINETMLEYGIDNSAQEQYLETLGFKLYPQTYSIVAGSIGTMSLTLNAAAEYYGEERRGVSGDGIVQNLAKRFGYETYGIFFDDYFFQGIGSSYDSSFPIASPQSAHEVLWRAIFMGELRFDVEFDNPPREQSMEYNLSILGSVSDRPRFVYMHSNRPRHSQNSGVCRPNETELFEERLVEANREMKQAIEMITQNDPDAILIVAGDHGPYLTKNCIASGEHYDVSEISRLDIQDRFGTFLAIKWPGENSSQYDDITVLQDLFPAVFAYLLEDDSLLEAKVTPTTLWPNATSGASVKNGIIHGGINDGEPLFVDQPTSSKGFATP